MMPMAEHIRAIERSRIQALVNVHMERLWQLHAPHYQLVTPSERTFTRERYLGDIKAGRLRYVRWDTGPMDVRVCDHMALVRYQATLELDSGNGRGTPFECWHTDSYERVGELWQAVWSQATALK